jgi:VIT1/CCC1 family predicted Fe2+/Mn2+ transporter
MVTTGAPAFVASLGVSLAALALLGAGIALLTRRPVPYGAVRQVFLGGVAAAVTYGVGQVVGVGLL